MNTIYLPIACLSLWLLFFPGYFKCIHMIVQSYRMFVSVLVEWISNNFHRNDICRFWLLVQSDGYILCFIERTKYQRYWTPTITLFVFSTYAVLNSQTEEENWSSFIFFAIVAINLPNIHRAYVLNWSEENITNYNGDSDEERDDDDNDDNNTENSNNKQTKF